MAWISVQGFREKFNVIDNGLASSIQASQLSATLLFQDILDAEIYNEAVGSDLSNSNSNYLRQNKVIQAHAFLSYYFLLKTSGNHFTRQGLVKQSRTGGANTFGDVIDQFLTPTELELKKAEALADAKMFLSDYGVIPIDVEGITQDDSVLDETTLKWF